MGLGIPSFGARGIFGWWTGRERPVRAAAARAGCAGGLVVLGFLLGFASREDRAGPVGSGVSAGTDASGGGDGASRFAIRYAELQSRELRAADSAEAALASVPIRLPVQGELTSSFTPRRFHPILRRVRPHWGIDIAAAQGTPVVASADGAVLDVARSGSYGLVVDVSHRDGEYITRHAHLSAVLVRKGQAVRRGEVIGRVGSTGLSTGPHLHYEVFVNGRRRDPALLIDPGAAVGVLP